MTRLCSTCHGTDVFAGQRHDKDKWNQIIDKMTSKGVEASDHDVEKMATYLSTYLVRTVPSPNPSEQALPQQTPNHP